MTHPLDSPLEALTSLCPEAVERSLLPEAEFWEFVFNGQPTEPDWDGLGSYEEPPGEELDIDEPCGVCGVCGACGYDTLGRPWIHAVGPDEEAEPQWSSP